MRVLPPDLITGSKPETISDLEQEALYETLRLLNCLSGRIACIRSVVNKYVISGLEVTDEVFESEASLTRLIHHCPLSCCSRCVTDLVLK